MLKQFDILKVTSFLPALLELFNCKISSKTISQMGGSESCKKQEFLYKKIWQMFGNVGSGYVRFIYPLKKRFSATQSSH